jgi:hypothetical protein
VWRRDFATAVPVRATSGSKLVVRRNEQTD